MQPTASVQLSTICPPSRADGSLHTRSQRATLHLACTNTSSLVGRRGGHAPELAPEVRTLFIRRDLHRRRAFHKEHPPPPPSTLPSLTPVSSESGTCKTVTASFWQWLSGKSPYTILRFSRCTRKRFATKQPLWALAPAHGTGARRRGRQTRGWRDEEVGGGQEAGGRREEG